MIAPATTAASHSISSVATNSQLTLRAAGCVSSKCEWKSDADARAFIDGATAPANTLNPRLSDGIMHLSVLE